MWVVRRMEIDFSIAPARIDDILTVETRTERISGARIFMAQRLVRDNDLLVSATVEAAIIGDLDGRSDFRGNGSRRSCLREPPST